MKKMVLAIAIAFLATSAFAISWNDFVDRANHSDDWMICKAYDGDNFLEDLPVYYSYNKDLGLVYWYEDDDGNNIAPNMLFLATKCIQIFAIDDVPAWGVTTNRMKKLD